MKKIKIPLVRVVFMFVALLAVNVLFLQTYVKTKNREITGVYELVDRLQNEAEQQKELAEQAAANARKAEAEAIQAQREAEKQRESAVAENSRLRKALQNCQK